MVATARPLHFGAKGEARSDLCWVAAAVAPDGEAARPLHFGAKGEALDARARVSPTRLTGGGATVAAAPDGEAVNPIRNLAPCRGSAARKRATHRSSPSTSTA